MLWLSERCSISTRSFRATFAVSTPSPASKVERLFKGEQAFGPGSVIVVNVPGGHLEFPNGSVADVVLTTGPAPLNSGHEYLLFLEQIDNPSVAAEAGRRGTFRPTGGSQGVFELGGSPPRLLPYVKGFPVEDELAGAGPIASVFEYLKGAAITASAMPGERTLEDMGQQQPPQR